jgi:hypothetical protein
VKVKTSEMIYGPVEFLVNPTHSSQHCENVHKPSRVCFHGTWLGLAVEYLDFIDMTFEDGNNLNEFIQIC